ncbi:MAG: glycosyltransferase [Pseudomonadota bacterium]
MAPKPIRILICSPYYWPATRYGGPVQSIHGLAKALVALGHTVRVFTTNMDGAERLPYSDGAEVERDGVNVRYFAVDRFARLFYAPGMKAAAAQTLEITDIVHLNGAYLWPMPMMAKQAQRHGLPYLYSPRGMLLPDLIEGRSKWVKKAWITAFERSLIAKAAALHATAEAEAQGLTKLFPGAPGTYTIGNGVVAPGLSENFNTLPFWPANSTGRRIAFLGRLDWMKGVDLLLDTVANLPDAQLSIAGPDYDGIKAQLAMQAQDLGISHRVRFLGKLDGEKKWQFLNSADCVVIPSQHESFGMTLVEAMAVGTPVVTSASVGASAVLAQVDAQSIVQRNAHEFAERVGHLLDNHDERAAIGRAAKAHVEQNHSWASIASHFVSVYETCIGTQNAP